MTGPNADGGDDEANGVGDDARRLDFWQPGASLDDFTTHPFAADDPEALPRHLGPLPGDPDGSATKELHRLYCILADEAEREALSDI